MEPSGDTGPELVTLDNAQTEHKEQWLCQKGRLAKPGNRGTSNEVNTHDCRHTRPHSLWLLSELARSTMTHGHTEVTSTPPWELGHVMWPPTVTIKHTQGHRGCGH